MAERERMVLVTLDFETYYDRKTYSLSRMTTEEYLNDPRFQIIGVSVKLGNTSPKWVSFGTEQEYAQYLAYLKDCCVVFHNGRFDASILSWRLGIKPRFLFDTMLMSRAKWGMTVRHDLGALSERLGTGVKGKEVHDANGLRLEDFAPAQLRQYGDYCDNDVALTHANALKMLVDFPRTELRRIDLTLRMYTQPVLTLNKDKIRREITLEEERKAALMAKLDGMAESGDLTSNDKFAELLRTLGVDPPTKISEKKSKTAGETVRTWAFAKGDADFKALLKHEDELVVAAVEARMGHKSTQKATRAQRFLGIAERMGVLPVPLEYYKAHTGRYGGCVSADTKIFCKEPSGLVTCKQIVDVADVDLVWDGEEFVAHGGVVYSGVRESVDYDGVVATPEHMVYTEDGSTESIDSAQQNGHRLTVAPLPPGIQMDPTKAPARSPVDETENPTDVWMWEGICG